MQADHTLDRSGRELNGPDRAQPGYQPRQPLQPTTYQRRKPTNGAHWL
jgi:hypothetical protein